MMMPNTVPKSTAIQFMEEYKALCEKYGCHHDLGCGCCALDSIVVNTYIHPTTNKAMDLLSEEFEKVMNEIEDSPERYPESPKKQNHA